MNEPQRTRQIVAGLLFLCFLLYFLDLGRIPFYNYEESKEALIVWEMVNGGGWILPLRNGVEQPLKPPLFHWIGAVVSLLTGQVSELAVRLPSALFATATVLATFFFGRALWSWRVGLLAALILATCPEWARWSINARSDMVLLFFLTAAQFFFFGPSRSGRRNNGRCSSSTPASVLPSWPKDRWGCCYPSWLWAPFCGGLVNSHFFAACVSARGC